MNLRPVSKPMKVNQEGGSSKYKGVRKRQWGTWVSEIRVPKTGQRIWLGSFDSPEKAARANDAALYCLQGENAAFNFPNDIRLVDILIPTPGSSFIDNVKKIARAYAESPMNMPTSDGSQGLPYVPVIGETETADLAGTHEASGSTMVMNQSDPGSIFNEEWFLMAVEVLRQ